VHRDFKSENVMPVPAGAGDRAVITISVASPPEGPPCDAEPEIGVAGTPSYMAPEQVRGTARSAADLYALGIVLRDGDRPAAVSREDAGRDGPGEARGDPPAPSALARPIPDGRSSRGPRAIPGERFACAHAVAALERSVRACDPMPLPAESDAFIGRERELADRFHARGKGGEGRKERRTEGAARHAR
jgi:serine/threonine protein kinase